MDMSGLMLPAAANIYTHFPLQRNVYIYYMCVCLYGKVCVFVDDCVCTC